MSGASASRVTRVGEITVVALPDGAADLPGWPMAAELAANNPVDWAAYAARNPGGFHGPEHQWRIHNTCFAVISAGETTLVDCGVGAGPYPWYAGLRGELPASLEAAGLAPADIDRVFLTHAHPDHVGWTFDEGRGAPRFPNARYVLHRRDWDEFAGRSPVPKHFTRFVEPLLRAGVLDMLDGERDVAPGVTAIETPGHTPGHMSLIIRSRGEGMVISGDVLNSPMYVSEPGRPFGPDLDQQAAIRTRVALVERIEAEGWRVAAAHFPEPGFGAVVRVEGKRWFAAL
jgi:glyoxylase-like metal-dependent hydrolase (beta-lactamase superfamily II)